MCVYIYIYIYRYVYSARERERERERERAEDYTFVQFDPAPRRGEPHIGKPPVSSSASSDVFFWMNNI